MDINLIINYDTPNDAEDYVHRVGRTARADRTGVAITLVNEEDMFRLHRIEELIGSAIPKLALPADLGAGPVWNPEAKRQNRRKNYRRKPHKKYGKNHKGKTRKT
jgi:superfamily II DNA/RNA helicase